jgi:threonine dehydratase
MKMERPTFNDVLEARSIIKEYLPRTPLYSYPQLSPLMVGKV